MAFPDDFDVNSLSREQVINLLLASIGFEELALAHLVKSQADLIRLGVDNSNGEDCRLIKSVNDILEINRSVNRTLRTITNKERILLLKLREVADLIEEIPPPIGNCCTARVETGEGVIDAAYINGETIGFGVDVDRIDISIGSNCKIQDNRIDLRFIKDACSFITITLVGETAELLVTQSLTGHSLEQQSMYKLPTTSLPENIQH